MTFTPDSRGLNSCVRGVRGRIGTRDSCQSSNIATGKCSSTRGGLATGLVLLVQTEILLLVLVHNHRQRRALPLPFSRIRRDKERPKDSSA